MLRRLRLVWVPFLASFLLAACDTATDPRATAYVVLDSSRVDTFLSDLAILSKAHGLTPHVGNASPDRGPTLHVFEARGLLIRLWAQNLPLNRGTCGAEEAQSDPNQFILSVTPKMSLPLRDNAAETSSDIAAELRSKGYLVLSAPAVPCGAALLPGASAK